MVPTRRPFTKTPGDELRNGRNLFANKVPAGGNDSCCALDRSAVLNLYQEALEKLELKDNLNRQPRILSEATRKIKVILGHLDAQPDDPVFSTTGMLLQPLEPQYAEPRIPFDEDQNGYRAQWRLRAWRKEGWPEIYPRRAIRSELNGDGKLVGGHKMSDRAMRRKALKWIDKEWGDCVDARTK